MRDKQFVWLIKEKWEVIADQMVICMCVFTSSQILSYDVMVCICIAKYL